jgi:hypothetical protein
MRRVPHLYAPPVVGRFSLLPRPADIPPQAGASCRQTHCRNEVAAVAAAAAAAALAALAAAAPATAAASAAAVAAASVPAATVALLVVKLGFGPLLSSCQSRRPARGQRADQLALIAARSPRPRLRAIEATVLLHRI